MNVVLFVLFFIIYKYFWVVFKIVFIKDKLYGGNINKLMMIVLFNEFFVFYRKNIY